MEVRGILLKNRGLSLVTILLLMEYMCSTILEELVILFYYSFFIEPKKKNYTK